MSYSRSITWPFSKSALPIPYPGTNHDSRIWSFAHQLNPSSELLKDFGISDHTSNWRKAIFMPGARQAGLRKSRSFPSIYVLTSHELKAYSHPVSGFAPFVASFDELVEITSQKALLYGVIELSTLRSTERIHYDSVHQRFADSLLRAIRAIWFQSKAGLAFAPNAQNWEPQLVVTCKHALRHELDRSESVLNVFPELPREVPAILSLFDRRSIIASYLVFTDRRIMRIELHRASKFGMSIRYVPHTEVMYENIVRHENELHLYLTLANDRVWHACIATLHEAQIISMLHRRRLAVEPFLSERGFDAQISRNSYHTHGDSISL